jgi:hypothetical protein
MSVFVAYYSCKRRTTAMSIKIDPYAIMGG